MPGESSSAGAWSTRLERLRRPELLFQRDDDPRLGDCLEFWRGNEDALRPGRAVFVGFPYDQGVQRNRGRVGAAGAPKEIRHYLHRLTAADAAADVDLQANPPLELGNVPPGLPLEEAQQLLGDAVGAILHRGAVPIVLGGGHETAFGHYLGYVAADRRVGIINIDAHLDVRPTLSGLGHSGSPFRQAIEHSEHPLPSSSYICLGAQPFSVARQHRKYLITRNATIRWSDEVRGRLAEVLKKDLHQLQARADSVLLTVDADVVTASEVPGVSAPNVDGLHGHEVLAAVRVAGASDAVSSFELVEINPSLDRDGQSCRWAALAVWHFLVGLAERPGS